MVLLGWAVRMGPVPIDDWFQQLGSAMGSFRRSFLVFSEPLALGVALVIGVIVAVRRHQSRLVVAMIAGPAVAIAIVQGCKRIFGRQKGGALAYPSGHTTFLVVVIGLLVLVVGVALWAIAVGVTVSLLGMFGQAITYHYFTDTIGAALLGTSVVCIVAVLVRGELSGRVGSTAADFAEPPTV